MIIENKPKIQVVPYGRIIPDLPNSARVKSLISRNGDINPDGRQSLEGLKSLHSELLIQVLYSSIKSDNAPQIFLIEITDTGYTRKRIGRLSIKNQIIQHRAIWLNLDQSIIDTLARYFPELDCYESLDKLLIKAIELLGTIPKKVGVSNKPKHTNILKYKEITPTSNTPKPVLRKKSRKVDHSELVGLIPTERILDSVGAKYSLGIVELPRYPVSDRVHTKQPDTRQGRF